MEHPDHHPLVCGCVCAGKMEGDIEGARSREKEFKNRQSRRISFFRRKWRVSRKGNEFLKIDGHVIVIYPLQKNNSQKWGFSIDNEYSNIFYPTREHALGAAFDKIEEIRVKG